MKQNFYSFFLLTLLCHHINEIKSESFWISIIMENEEGGEEMPEVFVIKKSSE
jgi:hypothetical protein